MSSWSPEQYERFRDERAAPFEDLVALGVWRPGLHMVDLGCGTGELTAKLALLSQDSQVLGVDSSASMLEKARVRARPGLRFELAKIETWKPDRALDVVFSHAALHWCVDHGSLFRTLASFLAPGGQLLVQMPSNHEHVSYRTVRELAASSPWKERLSGFNQISPVQSISFYAELLREVGLERPTVLEKVYGHVLDSGRGVLEWIKGALLVPYLERLGERQGQEFLEELGGRLETACPGKPYYFAFRRTLIGAANEPPE